MILTLCLVMDIARKPFMKIKACVQEVYHFGGIVVYLYTLFYSHIRDWLRTLLFEVSTDNVLCCRLHDPFVSGNPWTGKTSQ